MFGLCSALLCSGSFCIGLCGDGRYAIAYKAIQKLIAGGEGERRRVEGQEGESKRVGAKAAQ